MRLACNYLLVNGELGHPALVFIGCKFDRIGTFESVFRTRARSDMSAPQAEAIIKNKLHFQALRRYLYTLNSQEAVSV